MKGLKMRDENSETPKTNDAVSREEVYKFVWEQSTDQEYEYRKEFIDRMLSVNPDLRLLEELRDIIFHMPSELTIDYRRMVEKRKILELLDKRIDEENKKAKGEC